MTSGLTLKDVAEAACRRHDVPGGRALGRIAEKQGLKISYTTVDKILGGVYNSRPGRELLDGLAALSGMSREDVYQAAGQPMPLASLADQLPPDADLLTPDQRRAVLGIVRSLAAANRAVAEAEGRALDDGTTHEQEPQQGQGATPGSGASGSRRQSGAPIADLDEHRQNAGTSGATRGPRPAQLPGASAAYRAGRKRVQEEREQQDRDAEQGDQTDHE